jgi:hypothetical protein
MLQALRTISALSALFTGALAWAAPAADVVYRSVLNQSIVDPALLADPVQYAELRVNSTKSTASLVIQYDPCAYAVGRDIVRCGIQIADLRFEDFVIVARNADYCGTVRTSAVLNEGDVRRSLLITEYSEAASGCGVTNRDRLEVELVTEASLSSGGRAKTRSTFFGAALTQVQ